MSLYLTTEEFTCGHARGTVQRPRSTEHQGTNIQAGVIRDKYIRTINEALPIPTRCLPCVCQSILDASFTFPHVIPRSYLRDLTAHIRTLSLSARKPMRHELQLLGEQVRYLDDIDEFRKGVLALARSPEVSARFGL